MKNSVRKAIRVMQAAGLFRPFVGYGGNGIGRRAHVIAQRASACRERREGQPAGDDWLEVTEQGA